MKFELINPSDKIFFEAASAPIAAIAVLLISDKYGATNLDGGDDVPIFGFSPSEKCQSWFMERTEMNAEAFFEKEAAAVKSCLESFRYDKKQTSLNSICKSAKDIADAIEKRFS